MFYHCSCAKLKTNERLNGNSNNSVKVRRNLSNVYSELNNYQMFHTWYIGNVKPIISKYNEVIAQAKAKNNGGKIYLGKNFEREIAYVNKTAIEGIIEYVRKKNYSDKEIISRLKCVFLYDKIDDCRAFNKDERENSGHIYEINNTDQIYYSNVKKYEEIGDKLKIISYSDNYEDVIDKYIELEAKVKEYLEDISVEPKLDSYEIITPDDTAVVIKEVF